MGTSQSCELNNFTEYQNYSFGWKPDLPDIHDKYYEFDKIEFNIDTDSESDYDPENDFKIEKIDLRDQFPSIYNQENIHCSVPCSVLSVWGFFKNKIQTEYEQPSRIHLHQLTSLVEHNDKSLSIKTCLNILEKVGTVNENIIGYGEYPEQDEHFIGIESKPPKLIKYRKVEQSKEQLKRSLDAGFPIIFGMSIYSSSLTESTYKTGIIKMPTKSDQIIGGLSMVLVGYNNKTKHWIVRNNWGKSWGDKGYGYVPFNYLTNPQLAQSFWVIYKLEF
jgi:hypothetical protein